MKKNVFCLVLGAMLLAVSLAAQAQQPKKVPLIGILLRHVVCFVLAYRIIPSVCVSWVMWRGKRLSSNTVSRMEKLMASPSSPPHWLLPK